MRKTRRCCRHLREVAPAARAGARLAGRRVPAAADFQAPPTTSALAWKLLVRGVQLVAAVAVSQIGCRWAPWLAMPLPGGLIAVGFLLSLASSRLLPARSLDKAVALVLRHCQCG
jgi:hypothetical protein